VNKQGTELKGRGRDIEWVVGGERRRRGRRAEGKRKGKRRDEVDESGGG